MSTLMQKAKIVQNCYIVRDLEAACARLHNIYGIGPFLGGQESQLTDHVYRGTATDPIRIRGVFVQSGDLNVELVQLMSDAPSAFHDLFPNGEEGFHHVAVFCDDYDKERDAFAAAGYPVASEFTAVGQKICYVDARNPLGHMIELYPENPVIRNMYQATIDAANTWDGKHLIIPWDTAIRPAS